MSALARATLSRRTRLVALTLAAGVLALGSDAPRTARSDTTTVSIPPRLDTRILRRFDASGEGVEFGSVHVGPRGEHAAWRMRTPRGWTWVVDETPGDSYEDLGPIVYTADGEDWAYLGRNGDAWMLVVSGRTRPTGYSLLSSRSLTFVPGGTTRVAFRALRVLDNGEGYDVVVVDGRAGPTFRSVQEPTITFSPDGSRVAYVATDGETEFAVVEGKIAKRYPRGHVGPLTFSANGMRWAHVVRTPRGEALVVDGREARTYDSVRAPVFAPVGSRYAYVGERDGRLHVVTDGSEGPGWESVSLDGPVFSLDGAHVAFAASRGDDAFVVLDDRPGKAYPAVGGGSLRFSPDGKRLAHTAAVGAARFYVVDGVEQPPYEALGSADFSPDSTRFAYAAARGGRWLVVADGIETPPVHAMADGFPIYSPDGRNVVYVGMLDRKWHLFRDGGAGPAVDGIVGSSVDFSLDGKTPGCIVRRGEWWSLEACAFLSEAAFSSMVAGSELTPDGPRSFHAWFHRGPEILDVRVTVVP